MQTRTIPKPIHVLAADIGGTKALFALFSQEENGRLRLLRRQRYATCEASSLGQLTERFLNDCDGPAVHAAGYGFPGPIVAGRATGVNLPWPAEEALLRPLLQTDAVVLVNDLAAAAAGLPHLPPSGLTELKDGVADPQGPQAVIAAGTGLGMAVAAAAEDRRVVLPSEGGHRDFAPRNEFEQALSTHLRQRYGHVSIERVLSGAGLIDLYRFLLQQRQASAPPWLADCLARNDAGPIGRRGVDGSDPLCREAVDRFVAVYGAEAGNLALQYAATGGVFLAGGIAPQLLPRLTTPQFVQAFTAKGRLQAFLERIPVYCVVDADLPLYGAAHCARARLRAANRAGDRLPSLLL